MHCSKQLRGCAPLATQRRRQAELQKQRDRQLMARPLIGAWGCPLREDVFVSPVEIDSGFVHDIHDIDPSPAQPQSPTVATRPPGAKE
jgi:hypothetical protein